MSEHGETFARSGAMCFLHSGSIEEIDAVCREKDATGRKCKHCRKDDLSVYRMYGKAW